MYVFGIIVYTVSLCVRVLRGTRACGNSSTLAKLVSQATHPFSHLYVLLMIVMVSYFHRVYREIEMGSYWFSLLMSSL